MLTTMEAKVLMFHLLKWFLFSPRLFATSFLCDCVERQPDMLLKELQTELQDAYNVETSVQTIARTLQRAGYTMKLVRPIPLDQL
jgi:hypothetical protein